MEKLDAVNHTLLVAAAAILRSISRDDTVTRDESYITGCARYAAEEVEHTLRRLEEAGLLVPLVST